jgi:hypothetical protein
VAAKSQHAPKQLEIFHGCQPGQGTAPSQPDSQTVQGFSSTKALSAFSTKAALPLLAVRIRSVSSAYLTGVWTTAVVSADRANHTAKRCIHSEAVLHSPLPWYESLFIQCFSNRTALVVRV